jgi:hypothetical protein
VSEYTDRLVTAARPHYDRLVHELEVAGAVVADVEATVTPDGVLSFRAWSRHAPRPDGTVLVDYIGHPGGLRGAVRAWMGFEAEIVPVPAVARQALDLAIDEVGPDPDGPAADNAA